MNTWSGLNVEVTHELHPDSREVINRGLSDFNAKHLGDHKWMALDVYVRDPDGRIVAGLIVRVQSRPAIVACDFFVVVTAQFRILCILVVMELRRRGSCTSMSPIVPVRSGP